MQKELEHALVSGDNQLTLGQLTDILESLSAYESDPEINLLELAADQVLFTQGEPGDSMYVLIAGALGVRVRHKDGSEMDIDRLAPGAIVGEMALLSGQPRSATVFALVDAALIRLTKSAFNQLVTTKEKTTETLDASVAPRWQRVQLARALRGLFGDLDAASLHSLQDQMEWLHFSNGDIVFRQGDAADGMYVVVNGRLRATAVTGTGTDEYLGEIEPGQTVGEFALLTEERRAATVHAVRETNVVHITPAVFRQLITQHPELMTEMTRIIIERRQRELQLQQPTAPSSLTLALVPAGPTVDVWQFAQELAAALRTQGATLTLNGAQLDAELGQPGAAQTGADDASAPAVAARMDALEAEYKYLLFTADPTLSTWTQRCIDRADRVLIVADPQADPTPGAVEQTLAQMDVPLRTELVLWHPPETEHPAGTITWLEARHVHAHHHVRQGDTVHVERLARRLSGKAIAVVLSGGSARGFAHLGVHRVLEELDIPIDYVGGTSMGAVLGATIVTIESNARMMQLAKQFADPKIIFDRTLPLTAMMASRKVTGLVRELFGHSHIEDLWIPFFCVAANLTTAEPVVFQRGPIWRAVRASLSIPGVFAPVIEDGETIVDGGVMDNYPTHLMAQFCESERIIGVNVAPLREKKRHYDFDTHISGWRILLSRLNPFAKSLYTPSLVGTLMRTLEINSLRHTRENEAYADITIYPDVKGIGSQEYDKYEEIIRAGYEAALEPLRTWKESNLTEPIRPDANLPSQ